MWQFVRYAGVGLVATAVHYGVLIVAVETAAWPPWLASGYGATLGAQVAFLGNRWFTFEPGARLGSAWWRFQTTAALGASTGMVIVAGAARLGVYYLPAQMLATALVLVLSFAVNRSWSFRRQDRSPY
jgi:putative flippase GtrA